MQPEESHRIAFCGVPFPDESVFWGKRSVRHGCVISRPTISALVWSRPLLSPE